MNDITKMLIELKLGKASGNAGLAEKRWTDQLDEIRQLDEPGAFESLFEPEEGPEVPREKSKLWKFLVSVFGIFAVVIWYAWRKWRYG